MQTVCLHDKSEIAAFLRRDPYLHLYTLGDLDDFFWPYTTWYALRDNSEIVEVVLIYSGTATPTLLALTGSSAETMSMLLPSVLPLLPRRFYAHVSGDLANCLGEDYTIESHGLHYKMALTDRTRLKNVNTSEVIHFSTADVTELKAFYEMSYPGNWFDARMLETGYYYGIRRNGSIVSVAGVHVFSEPYDVAALGNITTHPMYRGQGLGKAVCARLCRALLQRVDNIGLNVKADNRSAIAAYEKLGFQSIAEYEECDLTLQALSRP